MSTSPSSGPGNQGTQESASSHRAAGSGYGTASSHAPVHRVAPTDVPGVLPRVHLIARAIRLAVVLGVWTGFLLLVCGGFTVLFLVIDSSEGVGQSFVYDVALFATMTGGLVLAPALESQIRKNVQPASPSSIAGRMQDLGARCLIVLAFVALASPFLLIPAALGGASPQAAAAHLLIIAVSLCTVCAMGYGLHTLLRQDRLAAGITAVLILVLTLSLPVATVTASTLLRIEQEQTFYDIDGPGTDCVSTPELRTRTVARSELVWWLLVPDPYAALADAAVRGPVGDDAPWRTRSLTASVGEYLDDARDPHPPQVTIRQCEEAHWDHSTGAEVVQPPSHAPFWPVTVLLLAGTGVAIGLSPRRPRRP